MDFSEGRRVSVDEWLVVSDSHEAARDYRRACPKMGAVPCVEVETLLGGCRNVDEEANGIAGGSFRLFRHTDCILR